MPPSNEEALFALALTKPAAERAAWLDRECVGDAALRQRLEALLAAHEQPDNRSGVPKVIDFGIAKATEGQPTDTLPWTKAYAGPAGGTTSLSLYTAFPWGRAARSSVLSSRWFLAAAK